MGWLWEDRILTVLNPKWLHRDPNEGLVTNIVNRMSSEIAITYRDFYKYKERINREEADTYERLYDDLTETMC